MANKRYDQFTPGTYDTAKIFLQADPVTGALEKVNLPDSTTTLPSQAGSSGKFLTTNGTAASWATSAASPWSLSGSDIYFTTGNVGIGTATPLSLLQLKRDGIGVTQDDSYGLALTNSTAATYAASGVYNQYSPPLLFSAYGWASTGGSSLTQWRIYNAARAYATSAEGVLKFEYSLNGGPYYTRMLFGPLSGNVIYGSTSFANNLSVTGPATLTSGANGASFQAYGNTLSSGVNTYSKYSLYSGFSMTGGTNTVHIFYVNQSINATGGTCIFRGFYFAPTITSNTGLTLIAFQNENGNNFFNSTSGATSIGVNSSIHASAILDITSTTQGVLLPRMSSTQKNAISAPATALLIFDTTLGKLAFYNGAAWEAVTSV